MTELDIPPRLSSFFRTLTTTGPRASTYTTTSDPSALAVKRRAGLKRAFTQINNSKDVEEELTIARFTVGSKANPVARKSLRDFIQTCSKLVGGQDSLLGHELAASAKLLYEEFCYQPSFGAAEIEILFGHRPTEQDVQVAQVLASKLQGYEAKASAANAQQEVDQNVVSGKLDAKYSSSVQGNTWDVFLHSGDVLASDLFPQGMASNILSQATQEGNATTQVSNELSTGNASASSSSKATSEVVDFEWLVRRCEQHNIMAEKNLGPSEFRLSPIELSRSLLHSLKGESTDDALQSELFDLLGMHDGSFEFIALLLEHRTTLRNVSESNITQTNGSISASADASDFHASATSSFRIDNEASKRERKWSQKQQRAMNRNTRAMGGQQSVGGSVYKEPGSVAPTTHRDGPNSSIGALLPAGSFGTSTQSKALPSGTKRKWMVHTSLTITQERRRDPKRGTGKQGNKTEKGNDDGDGKPPQPHVSKYEEVVVPAPIVDKVKANANLVPISEFSEVAQVAFLGIKSLNRLQSRLFETAYKSNHNLLVCAPTGAGKTNVAMTTVVREIERHIDPTGVLDTQSLKIIYVAPMKALAQEVVDKFGKRLAPLGIKVRELTGDMQLSKREIEETQLIVTTPEKWDVITRKSGDGTLVEAVGLLIIDEVHLVGEDRGPVIEALVARTLRLVEQKQKMVRIVGLSATLPNYMDVALFLRVDPNHGMFFFDNSFRPVPLQQTFVGVVEKNTMKRLSVLNELAYKNALDSVRRGHQVMIFVHSRKDTGKTARALVQCLVEDKTASSSEFSPRARGKDSLQAANRFERQVAKSRNAELRELCPSGIGIHHAGMLRADRTLTEQMFESGALSVLCCTATLAWGVNLPAHTVIIKGTQIYQPEKGGLVELNMQDVFQCFGRAGRPQYDTSGEAVLITEHEQLPRYLGMLNHALPLESQLIGRLPDALNAEIVSGTVTNVAEACEWLSYTFLHIRMLRNPMAYGVTYEDKESDPLLHNKRVQLIAEAARKLDDAKMSRFGVSKTRSFLGGSSATIARNVKQTAPLGVTDLGRVASHFYINHETIEAFNELLQPYMTDAEIIDAFCHASEFAQIKVRDEEVQELSKLAKRACPLEIKHGFETEKGKTAILFQCFITRTRIESFTLSSDMNYVSQNMARIARAVFEICMKKGWSSMAEQTLTICKAIDKRCWWTPFGHPLRQMIPRITTELVQKLEQKASLGCLERLLEMNASEVGDLLHHQRMGSKVLSLARQIPRLVIDPQLQPITRGILRVSLSIVPDFEWVDSVHGGVQSFWLWVEDQNSEYIYHSERFSISRMDWKAYQAGKAMQSEDITTQHAKHGLRGGTTQSSTDNNSHLYDFSLGAKREFTIPIFEPLPPQYYLRIESDNWMGSESINPLSLHDLVLPEKHSTHTDLLDLYPLPRSALANEAFERLYENKFEHFNPIQTQIFHVAYHTDQSYLLGAPTGSGKTIAAELALLRLFRTQPNAKAVYIAPLKALVSERIKAWRKSIGEKLGKRVEEMTGDVTPSASVLRMADVLITTPEKWDGVSRMWQQRKYVQQVQLVIIDEIHLLGEERGAILEVIVSRMRYMSEQQRLRNPDNHKPIRFVGLSTALANAHDLGDWLGVDVTKENAVGLYNFRPAVRPVPLKVHIQGFPGKHYCPRMATMNKPTYQAILTHSPSKPVLVFVASRRQTRLTALDLISFCAASDHPRRFLHCPFEDIELLLGEGNSEVQRAGVYVNTVKDDALRHTLAFGIGIHHAGLDPGDREIVERLFCSGKIQVLVCTSTLAWGVNFPAHLVVVKGTEYYDAKTRRYKPFPVTDVLQMMGRAGRPQFDDTGVAMILVEESLKNFYKKFLYEPFPVESHLPEYLHNHLNAEIASGSITSMRDAIEYLSWTYFFRRLPTNPSYYGLSDSDPATVVQFLLDMVSSVVNDLAASQCVQVSVPKVAPNLLSSGNNQKAAKGWGTNLTVHEQQTAKTELQLEPTALGKIASYYYVDHTSVSLFKDAFDHWMESPFTSGTKVAHPREVFTEKHNEVHTKAFHWLLETLSNATEYHEVPVRHNEDGLNKELASVLRWQPNVHDFSSPHLKTFLLLQAHMLRVPAPIKDYVNDTKSVLDQALRVLNAMVDVASTVNDLTVMLRVMRLSQYIVQGQWVDLPSICQLPGVSNRIASVVTKHNKGKPLSLGDISRMPVESATRLLRNAGISKSRESQLRNALQRINCPTTIDAIVHVKGSLLQEISSNLWSGNAPQSANTISGHVEVSIGTIGTNDNRNRVPFGNYPKSKDASWWLVLGNEFNVVSCRRIGPLGNRKSTVDKYSMDFELPKDGFQVDSLLVYLVSDSMFGLDMTSQCTLAK